MSLICEKGCGKCCEVGGTGMQLIATKVEAVALARATGRRMDETAGRMLDQLNFQTTKSAACPFYSSGVCTVYEHRPEVCRTYQCDGEHVWVKSEKSMADTIDLIERHVGEQVSDLRSWFPEPMANTIARHEKIAFQFSGGKDSTALLFAMREFWDRMTVYHLDSGDMHPETKRVVEQIRSMVPKFEVVQSNVFVIKHVYGIPTDLVPWTSSQAARDLNTGTTPLMQDRVSCCFRTVMLPLHLRMKQDGITLIVRGQKNRDDLKGALFSGDVLDGIEFLYPASDWTDEQCFQIMRDNGIEIPNYYGKGLVHSGDCLGCTAWCNEEDRPAYLKKYHPEHFARYAQDVRTIWDAVRPQIEGLEKVVYQC